jgi:hypothetical protein
MRDHPEKALPEKPRLFESVVASSKRGGAHERVAKDIARAPVGASGFAQQHVFRKCLRIGRADSAQAIEGPPPFLIRVAKSPGRIRKCGAIPWFRLPG